MNRARQAVKAELLRLKANAPSVAGCGPAGFAAALSKRALDRRACVLAVRLAGLDALARRSARRARLRASVRREAELDEVRNVFRPEDPFA